MDTFGPAESGVTLASLGRQTQLEIHSRQVCGELPWATPGEDAVPALVSHFWDVEQRAKEWTDQTPLDRHRVGPDGVRHSHPGNEVQLGGGLVDVWYLDDGTAIMTPELLVAYLLAYDRVTDTQGGKRNVKKTTVTIYASTAQRTEYAVPWQLERLATLATILEPTDPGRQLGVGLGRPAQRIADFRKKTQVVQQTLDRIRRIESTGAELALAQACLGVAKVTHLLRACGDELVEESESLGAFDRIQVAHWSGWSLDVTLRPAPSPRSA